MSLLDLFRPSLIDRGDAIGLEFTGREYTFSELNRRSNQLSALLADEGYLIGDRIAVYLENGVELIDMFLASVKLGLIFTPVNILYKDREIDHILQDAGPRAFFKHLPDGVLNYPEQFEPAAASSDTPLSLIYTSGTTGRPKGAILTHGNFAANARNLIEAWRITAEDRLLLSLPLFHVHGLGNGLCTWLAAGYRMRLLDRFRKETIVDELLDFRPTIFFGVPTMYERLLDAPPASARAIGRAARLFVSGSAPLPAPTFERFRALYGHAILERYGMTETLMNLSNPFDGERRPGTVGKPLPDVTVRLESGELLVKGPNVFAGYWRQPEATASAFTEDGFFRTGDLAVCSDDGYYTLEGRRAELIITGGFNVYPREVEEFLCEQPGVAGVAVVGAPHPAKGEVPVAFLVAEPGASVDTTLLKERCRANMASFKVPAAFHWVDQLPRNALGKIQRHLLLVGGKMTELEQIRDLLRSVWNGPAWHGPPVWSILDEVEPAEAVLRIGGAHTILELVSHMAACEQAVVRGIETGTAQVPAEENFATPAGSPEAAWRTALQNLKDAQRRLLEAIATLTIADLDRRIQGEDPDPHTIRSTLNGLVHHDAYHSGQVQILKRALAHAGR